jgi:hypothetical protein
LFLRARKDNEEMLLFTFTRFHIGKRCFFSTTSRRELLAKTLLTGTFICCFVFGLVPPSRAAQKRAPVVNKGSYYYRAYDQGFREGRGDYDAGRPHGYHAALVTTAGVASISQDYRNAFKLGYQDGYTGHQRGSDWYYRHHHQSVLPLDNPQQPFQHRPIIFNLASVLGVRNRLV